MDCRVASLLPPRHCEARERRGNPVRSIRRDSAADFLAVESGRASHSFPLFFNEPGQVDFL
jgi:hypothetical protein